MGGNFLSCYGVRSVESNMSYTTYRTYLPPRAIDTTAAFGE